jgi:glutamyl-Q tRNA(Asp) synthetase
VLLQMLLGLPAPIYNFHRLILDDDGRKLAKSRNSESLRDLREKGWTPQDVRRAVGMGHP